MAGKRPDRDDRTCNIVCIVVVYVAGGSAVNSATKPDCRICRSWNLVVDLTGHHFFSIAARPHDLVIAEVLAGLRVCADWYHGFTF